MITLLIKETSIIEREDCSYLEIIWRLNSNFGVTSIQVCLDSSMNAIPPDHQDGVSIKSGYPLSISFAQSNPVVSENRKVITFKIFNVSVHTETKASIQRKRIPFEWRNPNNIPERVEINIVAKNLFTEPYKEKLTGFNTKASIIEFLTHRNSSSFHFPKKSPIYNIPYWEFSKDAALYQALPNTTVKSITWSTELPYWRSSEGEQYLINQIRKKNVKDPSTIPIRIAICPFEFGIPSNNRRSFLREMEVHSRLGVKIYSISPRDLSKILSDKNSIALYGDGIGLDFQGTSSQLSDGLLSVMLDSYRIEDLARMYKEILRLSTAWSVYKKIKEISFFDEDSGIDIFNRLRYFKAKLKAE